MRFLRQELRCDGGGAGRWRGGTGVDYAAEIEVEALYSFRGEGLSGGGGYGLRGGGEGAEGEMTLFLDGGEAVAAPKYGLRSFGPCRIEARSPGGGGWGDPLDRPTEEVLSDVRNEVVSVEAARSSYGVVLTANGRQIDERATVDLRRRRRDAEAD